METEKFNSKTKGEKRTWIDVDETEIYAYIGLLICSGATKSNCEPISMLWCSDYAFQRLLFSATMSRTRFSQISTFLRFDDMNTRNERVVRDKLAPICEIMDLFAAYCQKYYNTSSHVTVDEQLVPFRGHAPFRVYMKSKPAKYGIKIWILADSTTSYCKNLQVYLGKKDGKPEREQGKRVVLDLVSILGPGYGVTTDNFFTSLDLAEELIERNLTLCGTLRKNKTFTPPEFLPSLQRPLFSSIFGFQSEATLVSYVTHKNRCVVLLSTEHYKAEIEDEDPQQKPVIITHYNNTKGGVDTLDRMVKEYSCKRQTKRWPVELFMNMDDISSINAFVLWKDIHPNWKEAYTHQRRLFLLRLGKLLVEPMMKRRLNDPSIRNTQSIKTLEMMTKCLENIAEEMEEDTGNERGSEMEPRREHSQPTTSGTQNKKVEVSIYKF